MADPLADLLGELPESVRALPDGVRQRLAELVVAASEAYDATEEEALAAALRGLPGPLQALLLRVVGG